VLPRSLSDTLRQICTRGRHNAAMPSKTNRVRLVGALAAALLTLPVATTGIADTRKTLAGVVVGIVDGDTADVRLASGMIRIRFHAIDAPESGQPHGQAAKAALSQLIYGKSVQLEPFEQDRYDRLVARVWLGDTDVNAEMIRTGNAWTYRRYADEAAYCAFEKVARDLGRGLWRLPAGQRVAPWEWRQRKTRDGRFTDYSSETVAACVATLGR
jgi:endonuclease YncB( thermonuclease family)